MSDDKVKEIQDFFADAEDFDALDRSKRMDRFDFLIRGNHWTDDEKRSRNVDGKMRPMLCLPYLESYCRRIANELLRDTPSPKYRPVNSAASAEAAKVLNGLALNYLAQSNADIAFDIAGKWQVNVGLGYFEVAMDYINGGSDQVPVIRPIYDPFTVYFDPESFEINGSDAMRCLVLTEMGKDKAEKKYGKDFSPFKHTNSRFINQDKVIIGRYFEIVEEEDVRCEMANGFQLWKAEALEMAEMGVEIVRYWQATRRKCEIYTVGGDEMLDDTIELNINSLPIIPVYGDLTIHDGARITKSMTDMGKEIQRIINYAESGILEYSGMAVKAKHVGDKEAFHGLEKFWESAHTSPIPFLPFNGWDHEHDRPINPPQLAHHPAIPNELMILREGARKDLLAVCQLQGTPGMEEGEMSNESGRAILAREKIASVGNFHFADNRSKSIAQCGRVLLDMMRLVAKDSRSLRILDESGKANIVSHDPEMAGSHETTGDGGIYNLLIGEYECVADTGPSYATQRQEGQSQLMELLQIAPGMLQNQPATILRQFDSPALTDLADAFDPPDGQGDPKAQIAQLQQQVQMLQQQLAEVDSAKVMNEQAKLTTTALVEQAKLELETEKAKHAMQIEEMRVIAEIYGTPKDEFERKLKLLEAERKQEEHLEDLAARTKELQLKEIALTKTAKGPQNAES